MMSAQDTDNTQMPRAPATNIPSTHTFNILRLQLVSFSHCTSSKVRVDKVTLLTRVWHIGQGNVFRLDSSRSTQEVQLCCCLFLIVCWIVIRLLRSFVWSKNISQTQGTRRRQEESLVWVAKRAFPTKAHQCITFKESKLYTWRSTRGHSPYLHQSKTTGALTTDAHTQPLHSSAAYFAWLNWMNPPRISHRLHSWRGFGRRRCRLAPSFVEERQMTYGVEDCGAAGGWG